MKKSILFVFTITNLSLMSIPIKAQILEIFAIDSAWYKVGDKIKMGKAMEELPQFTYVFEWIKEDLSTFQKSKMTSSDSLLIVSIKNNTKFNDYNVVCRRIIPSTSVYITYTIVFNKAIETGEVISKKTSYFVAPTSNESLKKIRRAKEKLDLGIITIDEYNMTIKEFKKYIKE